MVQVTLSPTWIVTTAGLKPVCVMSTVVFPAAVAGPPAFSCAKTPSVWPTTGTSTRTAVTSGVRANIQTADPGVRLTVGLPCGLRQSASTFFIWRMLQREGPATRAAAVNYYST